MSAPQTSSRPTRRPSVPRGYTVPRPGPVWGAYPQRDDRRGARAASPRRRRAGLDAARVAAEALRLLTAGALPAAPAAIDAIAMRLIRRGWVDAAVAPALALVAAVMEATVGWRPERNQLHCAALLLDGRLAQMDTGEGKTCAAALAAAVAALAGVPVHVLTANDYLAARDRERLAPMFDALGLTSAQALESTTPDERRPAYQAQIVYATARCVAFDWLRDGERPAAAGAAGVDADADGNGAVAVDAALAAPAMLRGLCMAIVDEADGILIDEARVPLVLAESRVDHQARSRLWRALDLAGRLRAGVDYTPGAPGQGSVATLTDAGRQRLAEETRAYGGSWLHPLHRETSVEQALHALTGLRRDVDYLVRDRKVVIVDAVSGRPSGERQWSRDLHALVALKERLPLPEQTVTRASTTYPRWFARYWHVAGLSGTLTDARAELRRQYGLSVATVPRGRRLLRRHLPMRLFAGRDAQFEAAAARAAGLVAQGRAVLLVTDSVDDTDALVRCCVASGLPVARLDARHDAAEAAVVAAAGQPGRITVATQMAGRGTDIELSPDVRHAGGLHIVNLQHNRSRRVDRQIQGRAGRRGDPGSVEHWIRVGQSPLSSHGSSGAGRRLLGRWADLLAERGASPSPGGRRISGRARAALAVAMLACYQKWSEWEDRLQRARVVQADREWERALHFAAPGQTRNTRNT